jgi:hypothetical protein
VFLKIDALAGFKREYLVSGADAMTNAPRRQGLIKISVAGFFLHKICKTLYFYSFNCYTYLSWIIVIRIL